MSEERDRVEEIWRERAQRSLVRDRQKPDKERAKYKIITEVTKRGKDIGRELDDIALALDYLKPAKILDIGTGYGMMALWLAQCGILPDLDYTACDWIDEYLDFHEETTGIRPVKWDGITLPFDDGAFDFVICYSVLLHVPPENLVGFFREMTRVSSRWIYVHTARPMKKSGVVDFNHDYYKLYDAFGVNIVNEIESLDGRRVSWLLQKAERSRLLSWLRLLLHRWGL